MATPTCPGSTVQELRPPDGSFCLRCAPVAPSSQNVQPTFFNAQAASVAAAPNAGASFASAPVSIATAPLRGLDGVWYANDGLGWLAWDGSGWRRRA